MELFLLHTLPNGVQVSVKIKLPPLSKAFTVRDAHAIADAALKDLIAKCEGLSTIGGCGNYAQP